MKGRWSHSCILGFTDTETVMLDFDYTDLETVKYWSRRTMKYFKLGGFLVLESSPNCYHVVFDRRVTWSENMSIVASVTLQSHNRGLRRWQLMQCRKTSATLRVSSKGSKSSPRIVYREGGQDDGIASYLEYSDLIKDIIHEISNC